VAMLRLAGRCRPLMHLLAECFLSNEDAIEASGGGNQSRSQI
jgi:hypothetical protein